MSIQWDMKKYIEAKKKQEKENEFEFCCSYCGTGLNYDEVFHLMDYGDLCENCYVTLKYENS